MNEKKSEWAICVGNQKRLYVCIVIGTRVEEIRWHKCKKKDIILEYPYLYHVNTWQGSILLGIKKGRIKRK